MGYDNQRFMFEGAKFVSQNGLTAYLANLAKIKTVAVTHISPYGQIDKLANGTSVGNHDLEQVLGQLKLNSISAAIRESPGAYDLEGRMKINPGGYVLVISTDNNGNITGVKNK